MGLGIDVGDAGATADIGRLRLNKSLPKLFGLYLSKTAPAVLGLVSSSIVVFSDGRLIRVDGGLEAPLLMTEERLPVAEWPRKVDIEVSVSEEIVDRGRMYSTLSENPTLAREGGRFGEFESSDTNSTFRSDG